MLIEDWTFREAEARLSEHRELRQVLGLASVPDFTTLYRFLQRLDDQTIDRAVGETGDRVAVDATGLAQGAVSTFFVRRMHHHGQKPLPWRHWLKWVAAVDSAESQRRLCVLGEAAGLCSFCRTENSTGTTESTKPRRPRSGTRSYGQLQEDGKLQRAVQERMMAGLSTRNYRRAVESVVEGYGIAKSSVSRQFVEASSNQLRVLCERRLEDLNLVVLMIDGIHFIALATPAGWLYEPETPAETDSELPGR